MMNARLVRADPRRAAVPLLPPPASRRALSRLVTDATGSLLPGVTIEARSPALIEQVRTATSDATPVPLGNSGPAPMPSPMRSRVQHVIRDGIVLESELRRRSTCSCGLAASRRRSRFRRVAGRRRADHDIRTCSPRTDGNAAVGPQLSSLASNDPRARLGPRGTFDVGGSTQMWQGTSSRTALNPVIWRSRSTA